MNRVTLPTASKVNAVHVATLDTRNYLKNPKQRFKRSCAWSILLVTLSCKEMLFWVCWPHNSTLYSKKWAKCLSMKVIRTRRRKIRENKSIKLKMTIWETMNRSKSRPSGTPSSASFKAKIQLISEYSVFNRQCFQSKRMTTVIELGLSSMQMKLWRLTISAKLINSHRLRRLTRPLQYSRKNSISNQKIRSRK